MATPKRAAVMAATHTMAQRRDGRSSLAGCATNCTRDSAIQKHCNAQTARAGRHLRKGRGVGDVFLATEGRDVCGIHRAEQGLGVCHGDVTKTSGPTERFNPASAPGYIPRPLVPDVFPYEPPRVFLPPPTTHITASASDIFAALGVVAIAGGFGYAMYKCVKARFNDPMFAPLPPQPTSEAACVSKVKVPVKLTLEHDQVDFLEALLQVSLQ